MSFLFYIILAILILLLIVPKLLVSLLTSELKKRGVDVRIVGFIHHEDIKTRGELLNAVFSNYKLMLSMLKFSFNPENFSFSFDIENLTLELTLAELDLSSPNSDKHRISAEKLLNTKKAVEFALNSREKLVQHKKKSQAGQILSSENPKLLNKDRKKGKKDIWLFFGTVGKSLLFLFLQRFRVRIRRLRFNVKSKGWDTCLEEGLNPLGEKLERKSIRINQYFSSLSFQYNNTNDKFETTLSFSRLEVLVWDDYRLGAPSTLLVVPNWKVCLSFPLAFRLKNSILKGTLEFKADACNIFLNSNTLNKITRLSAEISLLGSIIECVKRVEEGVDQSNKVSGDDAEAPPISLFEYPKNMSFKIDNITISMLVDKGKDPLTNYGKGLLIRDNLLVLRMKGLNISHRVRRIGLLFDWHEINTASEIGVEFLKVYSSNTTTNEKILFSLNNFDFISKYEMKLNEEKTQKESETTKANLKISNISFNLDPSTITIFNDLQVVLNSPHEYQLYHYENSIYLALENAKAGQGNPANRRKDLGDIFEMIESLSMKKIDTFEKYRPKTVMLKDRSNMVTVSCLDVAEAAFTCLDLQRTSFLTLTFKNTKASQKKTKNEVSAQLTVDLISMIKDLDEERMLLESGGLFTGYQEDRIKRVKNYQLKCLETNLKFEEQNTLELVQILDQYLLNTNSESPDDKQMKAPEVVSESKYFDINHTLDVKAISIDYVFREKNIITLKINSINEPAFKHPYEPVLANFNQIEFFLQSFDRESGNQRKSRVIYIELVSMGKEVIRNNLGQENSFLYDQRKNINTFDVTNTENAFNWRVAFFKFEIIIPNYFSELGYFISDFSGGLTKIMEQLTPVEATSESSSAAKSRTIEEKKDFNIIGKGIAIDFEEFCVKLEDSPIDACLVRFQFFVKHYITKVTSYNDEEIINQLRNLKAKEIFLVEFKIKSFRISLGRSEPMKFFSNVMNFLTEVDTYVVPMSQENFEDITYLRLEISGKNCSLRIRDYAAALLDLSSFKFDFQIVQTILAGLKNDLRDFEKQKIYVDSLCTLKTVSIGVGLCILPSVNAISKWGSKLSQSFSLSPSPGPSNASINIPNLAENGSTLGAFDLLRYKTHGRFVFRLEKKLKIRVLTDIFPFIQDGVILKIEDIYASITPRVFKMMLNRILIKRDPRPEFESHVLKIPKIEILVKFFWICGGNPLDHYFKLSKEYPNRRNSSWVTYKSNELKIDICINLPRNEIPAFEAFNSKRDGLDFGQKQRVLESMVKESEITFFHYQQNFFDWLVNLPQLREETLLIYGINSRKSGSEEDANATLPIEIKGIEKGKVNYSEYMDLLKYSTNSSLNKTSKQKNLSQMLSEVNVRLNMSGARFVMSNKDKPLQVNPDHLDKDHKDEKIIGLQFVIDSITFSSRLYQRPMMMKFSEMKKHMKKNIDDIPMVWGMKEGFGVLNYLYGACFNGVDILSSRPKEFETLRKANFKSSMSNIERFNSFFRIKNSRLTLGKMNHSASNDYIEGKSNHLFETDKNSEENIDNYFTEQLTEEKSPPIFHSAVDLGLNLKDFKFNTLGIFFKADQLIYEQDKTTSIEIEENKAEVNKIYHFVTFLGCKLLYSLYFTLLVKSIFAQKKKEEPKWRKIRRQSTPYLESPTGKSKLDRKASMLKSSSTSNLKESESEKDTRSGSEGSQNKNFLQNIKIVLNIKYPQFNIYYQQQNAQMLLSSKKDCFIILYENILKFDKLKIDKKKSVKICFHDLECFTGSNTAYEGSSTSILWIESPAFFISERDKMKLASSENPSGNKFELKEGSLSRIITCSFAAFSYDYFSLNQCEIDFSRPDVEEFENPNPSYWADEPRMRKLLMKVEKLTSYMDSSCYQIFKSVLDFIVGMVSSEDRIKEINNIIVRKEKELKKHTEKAVLKHIEGKIHEGIKQSSVKQSKVEFLIKEGSMNLLREGVTFLGLKIANFSGNLTTFTDEAVFFEMAIKKIEMLNKMVPENDEYSSVVSMLIQSHEADDGINMLAVKQKVILLWGLSHARWPIYEQYEIKFPPLIIKMTEELYGRIYEFTFKKNDDLADKLKLEVEAKKLAAKEKVNQEKMKKMLQERMNNMSDVKFMNYYRNSSAEKKPQEEKEEKKQEAIVDNMPSYYQYIKIGELKLSVSYKCPSKIKRLHNMVITMEPFVKYQRFCTSKKVFDDLAKYIKKKVKYQIISLLSQKIGVYSKDIEEEFKEDEDDDEKDVKRK